MTDSQARRAPGWVPDLSTFGARLALVRQHMGWGNVKQAAELCAIPVQTWRTWERDGMVPRNYINACMKIAGVTGVDLNWLAVGPHPAVTNASTEDAGVTTHGYTKYHAIEERVIRPASTPGALSTVRTDVRKNVRATPLER
jgi:hypothetical protein